MIKGSIVAVVTPMFPDGAVDWDSLSALVEWNIAEGTDGIVAVGTTGEPATLNVVEHIVVIRRVVNLSQKRVPTIPGPAAHSTSEAIEPTHPGPGPGAHATPPLPP